jgi:phosphoglycerate dehydrogenase-like enzyme
MSPAADALVACIHHPAAPDLDRLRRRLADLPRPVSLHALPYKENHEIRMARTRGPLSSALRARVPEPDAEQRELWQRAEVVLALDLPSQHLSALPKLRWVQAYSSGVEHFDLRALAAQGVVLSSAAGVGAVPIAEFVLGRLLEVWKQSRALESMQRGRNMKRTAARLLAGSTLGIVGFGAIGRAIAERAHALGMRVIANRKHPAAADPPAFLDALHGADGFVQILAESDAVVLCVPDAADTRNLIDAKALARMRPGSVLCNVARGSLVDEGALIAALRSGQLGAAILDVTRVEPLPTDDPLWEAPNLYLSPHSAVSPESYDARLLELFAENLERYVAGVELRNRVSLDP